MSFALFQVQKGLVGPATKSFLGLKSSERRRQYVELQRTGDEAPGAEPSAAGNSFCAMLAALVSARRAAECAATVGDLASAAWWEERGVSRPPPAPPGGEDGLIVRE